MLRQMEGIVLHTRDYGETHKIVTLFTREAGKLTALARGANKPKSRLSAISQVFIQGDFLIFISKGLSTIQQGQITQSYRHIREDIIKTAYAAYLVELTEKIMETKEPDPFIYDQLAQTLHYINAEESFFIPMMMYELKMYKKGGFALVTDRCVHCYTQEFPYAFSVQEGGLLCRRCTGMDPYAVGLSNAVAKLLPILEQVGLEQVGNISVKKENQMLLRTLLDHYYDQYGGFYLKSKKFLKQLDLLKE